MLTFTNIFAIFTLKLLLMIKTMRSFRFSLLNMLIATCFSVTGYGQDWNAIFTLETDAEYYMAEGNFSKAADTYVKALKKFPESANLKFKIGYCLLKTPGRKQEAISYLEEAVSKISDKYDAKSLKEPSAPPEALYHLGIAYMHQNDFDNALKSFKEYQGYIKPKDEQAKRIAEHAIASCENAKNFQKSPIGIKYNPLGPDFNNENDNFNAVVSGDGTTLAYTTRTSSGNKIFIAKKGEDGLWGKPVDITRNLGSKNLTTSFLSYEGTELYLIENNPKNSEIVVSFLQKRKWSSPVKAAKPINSKLNETHICVTRDGNTVYFTSDRKGGQGGYDIWVSTINNGRWSDPINLGPNVNTGFDEATPFLSPDEKYLFFSSQGHNTMGGFDVFFTNLQGSPNVRNAGYPLNTTDDEIFYFPTSLSSGYISKFTPDGFGKLDIAEVEIIPLVDVKLNLMLADNAPLDKYYNVNVINNSTGEVVEKQSVKGKTQLSLKVKPGNYTVTAQGEGFEETKTPLNIPVKPDKSEYQASLMLNPRIIQQPIAQLEPPKEEPKPEVKPEAKATDKPKADEPEPGKEPAVKQSPKKEPKPEVEKPKPAKALPPAPPPTAAPTPKMDFSKTSATRTLAKHTYSVQLMASLYPVDYNYFKLDSISVTISPDGYYRYSVGNTDNIKEIEELQQKVRGHGYSNVWVRINREHPGYTIQFLALQKPKSIKQFTDLSDVMVYRGHDGIYRYCVGKYSTPEEANADLAKIVGLGYSGAFVRELGK